MFGGCHGDVGLPFQLSCGLEGVGLNSEPMSLFFSTDGGTGAEYFIGWLDEVE